MHQEEELRKEEEAYYQAKREAARVSKALRRKEQAARLMVASKKDPNAWLGEDESDWEMYVPFAKLEKTRNKQVFDEILVNYRVDMISISLQSWGLSSLAVRPLAACAKGSGGEECS